MDPRHSRGPIGPCLAFVAPSLTPTLSCSPPNRSPDGAFADLLGRHAPLPQADLDALADLILQVPSPPNPIRALDNSRTATQDAGRQLVSSVHCSGVGPADPSRRP